MDDKSRFLSQLDRFKAALAEHECGWKRVTKHVQKNFRAEAKELISELEYFYRARKEQIWKDFEAASAGQSHPLYSDNDLDIGAQLLRLRQVLNNAGTRKRRKFPNGREDIPLTKPEVKKIRDASYKKCSAPEQANVRQLARRHLRKLPAALERDSVVLKLFFILVHVERRPPGYTWPPDYTARRPSRAPYGKHAALFDAVLRWLFPHMRAVSKDRLIKYLRGLRKTLSSTGRRSHRLQFVTELLAVPWFKAYWGSDKDFDLLAKAGVIKEPLPAQLKEARTRKGVLTGEKLGAFLKRREFLPPDQSLAVSVDPEGELETVRQAQREAQIQTAVNHLIHLVLIELFGNLSLT